MHPYKYFILCLMLAWFTSCIKSYEPGIATSDVHKLVVSAVVTDGDGNQSVSLSVASTINKPEDTPLAGCVVSISDSLGHQFPMTDGGNGTYHGYIDPVYLFAGNAFRIDILTPDGSAVQSDFDRLAPVTTVDSVYALPRDIPTTDPAKPVTGLQFYADLSGGNTDSRLLRMELIETWEYHADYPIEWYFDGKLHHLIPPDYSKDTCWISLLVRNIYILSTQNLSENKYNLFPLNFVDNITSRLLYGYSLRVNQYSLSPAAYNYWNLLKVNSTDAGGLYERQPMATRGNLRNLTHPEQDVLGFFGASMVQSKRIFLKGSRSLASEYYSPCATIPLSPYGFKDLDPMTYPVYLVGDRNGWQPTIMHANCVDCRASGGKTQKPDFWPK